MKRKLICLIAIAALMGFVVTDSVDAKKRSRAAQKSSRSKAKKVSRAKPRRGKTRYARSRRSRRRARSNPIIAEASPRAMSGIPSERVTEIQSALIKLGYLEGPANGEYNDATIQAVKEFQADNSLSQTGMPSAHLLKKLGVAKTSNDGYAVPVKKAIESEKHKAEKQETEKQP
ncbi:MAG: peptidoglycan-binding domain-containing protein [Acidobacteriota bacterium]